MTERRTHEGRTSHRGFMALSLLVVLASVAGFAGCRPVPESGRFIDEVFPNVTRTADIAYGAAPDENGATETLRLDLYQPTGDTWAQRPAIIFIHGGGFVFGSRADERANAEAFARRGYVTVAISYRLGGNIGQAMVNAREDAQAAVRWLRRYATQYRVNGNQIATVGTSAGAITALNVAFNPEQVGNSGNPGFPSDVRTAISVSGFGSYVTAGDPPVIMFHGTADRTVGYQLAVDTCDLATEVGNHCELVSYEGAGHNLGAYRADIYRRASVFLYRNLGLSQ